MANDNKKGSEDVARLKRKVAVITGTGGGMGREAAIRFSDEGALVVGCDIHEASNDETVAIVRSRGGEMTGIAPVDAMVEKDVERLMTTAVQTYGGVDVLYNNVGWFRLGNIETQSLEDFEYGLRSEISTVFLATKHIIPHFRRRGGGSIINIGSCAGQVGTSVPGNLPGAAVHCVTKAGVIRFTQVAAVELASLNIRVNAISPGPILTPQTAPVMGDPELSKAFVAMALTDRIGRPSDVVNAAVFLASDEAEYITGANLNVDGGVVASGGRGRPDQSIAAAFDEMMAARQSAPR
jgi:NAD(P)-dependent dehydrogenase (short-subunit alcohol dehydrogenase family)